MAQPRQQLAEDRPGGHLREVGVDDLPRHSEVAAELYQARFRRGVDLALVANELRIHYEQLLALEEGRFDDLPGPTYVIGFLRSYAGYLNLDADDLVRRFKDETAYRDSRPDLTFPSPQDEGRVPTGALIALSLALVGAAYGGWHYVASVDRVTLEKVPAVPPTVIVEAAPEAAPPSVETIGKSLAVAAMEQAAASPT
ncbi:MAG: helix-turn-helix domain-containing protein, partial [Pseudomonadota bacterium]|nr:helix-turn-helix domain-containing protein [Pseudomonadota bacterium]